MHRCRALGRFDKRADGGGCSVKNADLVILDDLPKTTSVREGGHTFKHDLRAAQGQGAIADVGVTGHPTDVGGTPKHIVGLQVKSPFSGECSVHQVAAGAVLNTFGLAGGTRGVEQKQRVLGLDPNGFAGGRLAISNIGHPHIATSCHSHIGTSALDHQHMADAVATTQAQRLVDDGFQGQLFATTHLLVSGDDHLRAGIFDAVTQALRREAAKHHRVGCTDASTSLHGSHALDGHRDVNDDAVAFLYAQLLHRVGDLASTREQLRVGSAGDLTTIGFKNNGGLVAQTLVHMAV